MQTLWNIASIVQQLYGFSRSVKNMLLKSFSFPETHLWRVDSAGSICVLQKWLRLGQVEARGCKGKKYLSSPHPEMSTFLFCLPCLKYAIFCIVPHLLSNPFSTNVSFALMQRVEESNTMLMRDYVQETTHEKWYKKPQHTHGVHKKKTEIYSNIKGFTRYS